MTLTDLLSTEDDFRRSPNHSDELSVILKSDAFARACAVILNKASTKNIPISAPPEVVNNCMHQAKGAFYFIKELEALALPAPTKDPDPTADTHFNFLGHNYPIENLPPELRKKELPLPVKTNG